MVDAAVAKRTLRLFNEKAERLLSRRFTKAIHRRFGVSFSWQQGSPLTVESTGPDDEAVEAFVLTFRFFVQDNEAISLRNMARLYEETAVAPELNERFRSARDEVNRYLDSDTMLTLNGETIGRRRVLDVFLYGGMSHATPEKKAVYDSWVRDPFVYPLLQHEFITLLSFVLSVVACIRQINERALSALGD